MATCGTSSIGCASMSVPDSKPNRSSRLAKLAALALSLALMAVIGLGAIGALQGRSLPDGPGAEIAKERGLNCHGPEPLLPQQLTRTQVQNEDEKMIRWET